RPVALKIQSADIPHKTEAGGVALNVAGADVRAAHDRIVASARKHAPAAHIDGVLVQPMAQPGREVILGINRDSRWGPMLMVGLGGVLVEAMADTALAPVPLEADAARALIGRLKGARLFEAFRGAAPADVDALAELMVKLSRLAADHADAIAEIDLNPVIVHAAGDGVTVVDALILKAAAPAQSRDAAE
ncbi:MAG: acetate--CoA ligase family protein, partial [Pseudolabrys sp.]